MERFLSEADDGTAVMAAPGDALVVRLNENPTTGYRWALAELEGDAVTLEGDDFVRSAAAGVGGGGRRVLTFSAARPGTARIALKHWRRWEGDDSILERFSLTVGVRASEGPGGTGDPDP